MPKIYFVDVTNRDGAQTARITIAKLQKTVINWLLDEMGVYQSEMGFPLSPHEWDYINANVALTRDTHENGPLIKRLQLSGWSRALAADVHQAQAHTDLKHFNLSISTSEQMLEWKFQGKFTREDIIKMMVDSVVAAKEGGAASIGVNAEDASRTDIDFLIEFAQAGLEAGAVRFRYCDTLGYDDPVRIAERVALLAKESGMDMEMHCHNDLGLAVANSVSGALAVCEAGVDAYVNTTVNGIGERTGNADLLSCILALKYSAKWGQNSFLDENLDLTKSWQLAKYVSQAVGVPLPINQVGVGANTFAHESGIHADGALKDRHNYELYDFEELGRGEHEELPTGRVITTGVQGGTAGLEYVYGSHLDLAFRDKEHSQEILRLVQYANLHTQAPLTDEELWLIYYYPEQVRQIIRATP